MQEYFFQKAFPLTFISEVDKVVATHQPTVYGNQIELVAGFKLTFTHQALKTLDVIDVLCVCFAHYATLTD